MRCDPRIFHDDKDVVGTKKIVREFSRRVSRCRMVSNGQIQSLPWPTPSKALPDLVLRSCNTGTESRFINFSDGGGEPSTQPFQPFFTATRFLGGSRRGGGVGMSSSSSGVNGLLEEAWDVEEDVEGPGVDAGDDGRSPGGGGEIETDLCILAM